MESRHNGVLKKEGTVLVSLWRRQWGEDKVKGRGHKLQGNGPAVSLKKDKDPQQP